MDIIPALLKQIDSPADLREFKKEDIGQVCEELRQ